ncbi:hypothetical protein D3C85_1636680 [compost metagenome]
MQSVIISIDIGILTALLSISFAVAQSQRPNELSGLALYWSEFTDVLIKEIERGWDADLKDYLRSAKLNANPAKMEALVHEPAT